MVSSRACAGANPRKGTPFPLAYGRAIASRFLDGLSGEERNYRENTAQEIDTEVRTLLEGELTRARQVLRERRPALLAMAKRLLAIETLNPADVEALLAAPAAAAAASIYETSAAQEAQ